jgi:hypothetical protein
MTMMEFFDGLKWVAENYGLYAAIVVYFLARDAWRDYKQDKLISGLQTEMRGVILPIVKENAQVIATNSAALDANKTVLKEGQTALTDCRAAIQECRLVITAVMNL